MHWDKVEIHQGKLYARTADGNVYRIDPPSRFGAIKLQLVGTDQQKLANLHTLDHLPY